jgi:hypothetical protein
MCLIENTPSPLQRLRLALNRSRHLIRSWRLMKGLVLRTRRPEVFGAQCFALIDLGFVLGLLGIAGR